jgi:ABC-type Fe3+-siderophore transport system permease subunit
MWGASRAKARARVASAERASARAWLRAAFASSEAWRPRTRTAVVLGVLAAALVVAMAAGVAIGSVQLSPGLVGALLLHKLGVATDITWRAQDEVILFDLRLPRVIGAALVGASLALSGALFQGLLRNPLADPYVIGSSGGASFGALLGIVLGAPLHLLGFGVVQLAAFAGALVAVTVVYQLARVGGHVRALTLLLAGFAVSALFTYAASFLLIASDSLQLSLPRIYAWLLGGVAVESWASLVVVAPLTIVTAALALTLAPSLNALALGEDGAARLGIAVERDARFVLVAGSLLTATAVSVSGMIGFVGLVVPHVVRLLWGPDHRLLLPAAALGGATFLVVADLLARSLLPPSEIPVGILTAFIGAPYFLYLLRRTRREYGL